MVTDQELQTKPYWLYLLECQGGSFYAGIALDVQKRLAEHRQGKGAAYTRSRPPVALLACRQYPSRSEALKAEYAIKQLPKARKLKFFLDEQVQDSGFAEGQEVQRSPQKERCRS
jgi:putative endonuclease